MKFVVIDENNEAGIFEATSLQDCLLQIKEYYSIDSCFKKFTLFEVKYEYSLELERTSTLKAIKA